MLFSVWQVQTGKSNVIIVQPYNSLERLSIHCNGTKIVPITDEMITIFSRLSLRNLKKFVEECFLGDSLHIVSLDFLNIHNVRLKFHVCSLT